MKPVWLAAIFSVALISGCATTDDSGPGATPVGTYSLVSVNGSALPATTQNDATIKTEVLSGTFVVNADESFSESRQGRITLNGGAPQAITATQTGTWTVSGTQLSFVSGTTQNPVIFTGTYVAGTLTYTSGGATFVYQQQSSGV
jgi:hypothetical protein